MVQISPRRRSSRFSGIGLAILVLLACSVLTLYIASGDPQREIQLQPTASGDLLLDDFESPAAPSPWTFFNGAEFPGAAGSLASGLGYHGKGAHLSYDFRAGGNYVSANLRLPAPLNGEAISFRVKAPGGSRVTLRVNDATEQVLQYQLSRPLEATNANTWYEQTVRLDTPTSFFGGANDGIVHGGIVRVGILTSHFGQSETGPVGAIDFDEVALVKTIRTDLDPFDPLLTPAPPDTGNLVADLSVNVHFPMGPNFNIDTRALDAARNAGFSWVRMDLFWADVETAPGIYDFTNFDKLVTALETRGMKPLFILDYSSLLHSDCPACPDWFIYGPQSQATVKAFGDYAEASAKHFVGRGVRYEIWNEPNLSVFWRPLPDATKYAALIREAIARVHAGDPSALVATAGLSEFDYPFLNGLLSNGAAEGADAIAIHPYRRDGPETATDELVLMKSILASKFSSPPPIWNTEWGYSSSWLSDPIQSGSDGSTPYARHRHAAMVMRELLSARVMGFPFSSYYDIRDDGVNPLEPEHNFGLLANDYSDKPAIIAVRALKSISDKRYFVGTLTTQPSNLHALRLDGAMDTVLVLWMDLPGTQVSLSLPPGATAIDMFGAPISLPISNGRAILALNEASGPIYVTFIGTANVIDETRFFLFQHYRDFLGREPDINGLEFWTGQMNTCAADPVCLQLKRIHISGAFFLSIEFQETGYLIERIYKSAFGDDGGTSTLGGPHQLQVPAIRFKEFQTDLQSLGRGAVVGQPGWETALENNKQAFLSEFVQRKRFVAAYPIAMTPAQFVNRLFANAAVAPSAGEVLAATSEFGTATDTSNTASRARALRRVAENLALKSLEFNRAFVLMEYFGYLHRDPNSGPDADYSGFEFWLTKLNQFGGDFVRAQMVESFITSTEYRQRFRPTQTSTAGSF